MLQTFRERQKEMLLTQLGVCMLTLLRAEPPDDLVHVVVQQIRRAVPGWPALRDTTDLCLFERVIATKLDLLQMWHSADPSTGGRFPSAGRDAAGAGQVDARPFACHGWVQRGLPQEPLDGEVALVWYSFDSLNGVPLEFHDSRFGGRIQPYFKRGAPNVQV